MRPYQIVLVNFPFDDMSQTKVRPALCLTEPLGKKSHIVVAFISSQVPLELEPYDILVDSQHVNFEETGLHTSSVIHLQRLLSVPDKLLIRRLGVLPENLHISVKTVWLTLFKHLS
jgi:mRNA interferase MazF